MHLSEGHARAMYRSIADQAQRWGEIEGYADAQVSIDTACSSALVGAHAAAQHLGRYGGAALSAGVNLMLAEHTTAATHIAGAMPPVLQPPPLANAPM